MPGASELIIVALVIMVLFGGAAIPKFAKNLGKAKSEFEKGMDGNSDKTETSEDKDSQKDKRDEKKNSDET